MIKDKEYRRPALRRNPRLFWRRVLAAWPFLLWLAAVAGVVLIYGRQLQPVQIPGLAVTKLQVASPVVTGRIREVLVSPGREVREGEVMVRMETDLAESDAAMDGVRLLQAEASARADLQSRVAALRQAQAAADGAAADLEADRLAFRRDQAILDELLRELARMEPLVLKGLAGEQDMSALRTQIAEYRATVAAYPQLLALRAKSLANATSTYELMKRAVLVDGAGSTNVLESAVAGINAVRESVAGVRRQWERGLASYEIRAGLTGVVSAVYFSAGDVVRAGTPVVRVAAPAVTEVTAYVPEAHAAAFKPGDKLRVWSAARPEVIGQGTIVTIAPEIEAVITPDTETLLDRMSSFLGRGLRARRMMVRLEPGISLVPGETVHLGNRPTGGWVVSWPWSKPRGGG